MKILVVDDSKAIQAFARATLLDMGISCELAGNGMQAIAILEERQSEFDLVLMDWEMPVMDGITTLKEIRARAWQIPIIMVTTKNALEDITAAIDAGANEYVMKPYTKDILHDKIFSLKLAS